MNKRKSENSCVDNGCSNTCGCGASSGLSRRDLIKAAGATAAGIGLGGFATQAIAGPFTEDEFTNLVPEDKKLSAEWLKSLYERGIPAVYKDDELKYIGMPVCGICAGQVYIGGDGRLWHWDIFNTQKGLIPFDRNGAHYAEPMNQDEGLKLAKFDQGFVLRVHQGADTQTRTLDKHGFSSITFNGQYPIANVEYRDGDCPVQVNLETFSPFIPLDADCSGLPAIVMHYTLKNTSDVQVKIDIAGYLNNVSCKVAASGRIGRSRNRLQQSGTNWFLICDTAEPGDELSELPDYGSMCIAFPDPSDSAVATADISGRIQPEMILENLKPAKLSEAIKPLQDNMYGALGASFILKPGESKSVPFIISWHFQNLHKRDTEIGRLEDIENLRAYYQKQFQSADKVAEYVTENFKTLTDETRLWRDTWYDSTLPYWFLDRTFIPINALASATCMRFDNGRFYAMEGIYCCPGTCTHVWQYAQSIARIFPELERDLRSRVDFGLAMKPSGEMGFRAEYERGEATDGQAGTIIRAYREHLISADSTFLKTNWPNIKKAMEFLINKDPDRDGIIEEHQHNTLDSAWYGPVAWISGLYISACKASEAMAREMGDISFSDLCHKIWKRGSKRITSGLFNGEYFYNRPSKKYAFAINSNKGCHIDQVLGQSFAWQVGLDRVLPAKETISALRSLWKYNFTPDVGPYREQFETVVPGGRWYAMPGEGGLIMTTFPKGGGEKAGGKYGDSVGRGIFIGYFNECMTGFEYQVASHMIWEGMIEEGLAITRMIHDRYHASKRNPWNEIECSDHYGRAMASYGVFLAACGFKYHGPNGHIGFAPRLNPEYFKSAFTAAEGWGTYSQKQEPNSMSAEINIKWGSLKIRTIELSLSGNLSGKTVNNIINNGSDTNFKQDGDKIIINLPQNTIIKTGEMVDIQIYV